jgi:hypothetical protein
MRRRIRLLAAGLVALGVLASTGHAQPVRAPFEAPSPRLRFSPFATFAPQLSRTEVRSTEWPDRSEEYEAETEVGGGYGAGAQLEYRAVRQLVAFGGAAVLRRHATPQRLAGGVSGEEYGSDYVFVRGGLGLRLEEAREGVQFHRVHATVAVGPAWVRELPRGSTGGVRPVNLWGVHFMTTGELLLPGDRVAITAGVEDNLLWWNAAELARRVDGAHARRGEATLTSLRTTASHHWVFRAGFTLRL